MRNLKDTIKRIFLFYALLLFATLLTINVKAGDDIHVIPEPVSVTRTSGYFILPKHFAIEIKGNLPIVRNIAEDFSKKVSIVTGFIIDVENTKVNSPAIRLLLNESPDKDLGAEGYTLSVSSQGVLIHANQPAGLFYGLKTLLQLLPPEIESKTEVKHISWQIPALT